MTSGRITKRVVDALTPRESEYVHWDGELKGFGVRVRPTGAKSFIAIYRTGGRNSSQRKVTIGAVRKIEATAARNEARRIIRQAELGIDHAAEKAKLRAELKFSEVCDIYLREGCETKKPSTIATDKGRIERHIKPLLGKKRVSEISRADIEKFMRDIASGKTATDQNKRGRLGACVSGGKGTATRTVGLLGGIMSFAVARQMRADNPVRGVKRYPDHKNETFLSPQQLSKLGKVMAEMEGEGVNPSALAIIRLLALTGARKSEITRLRWSEVDLERSYLNLGDSKTGAKVLPLGAPAREILFQVPKTPENPFVFCGGTGQGYFQGTEKVWRRLRERAGFPNLRIHDLRHSFASIGLARGDALPIIGAILGHADVKTTSRYAHLADDPVRSAADGIAKTIHAAFLGSDAEIVRPIGSFARPHKKN